MKCRRYHQGVESGCFPSLWYVFPSAIQNEETISVCGTHLYVLFVPPAFRGCFFTYSGMQHCNIQYGSGRRDFFGGGVGEGKCSKLALPIVPFPFPWWSIKSAHGPLKKDGTVLLTMAQRCSYCATVHFFIVNGFPLVM